MPSALLVEDLLTNALVLGTATFKGEPTMGSPLSTGVLRCAPVRPRHGGCSSIFRRKIAALSRADEHANDIVHRQTVTIPATRMGMAKQLFSAH
ncbi:MAG: hypothetical protein JOZ36_02440 [Acidobacteria bacterium]|nr:hypothetical protein [Acidobacteriota bacterium]